MAVVLIIEDDPALSVLLRQVLEDEGHRAVVASTMGEAAEAIRSEPVELVLADLLEFDLLSGPGSVEALRALAGGRPVLLCTGQPEARNLAALPGLAGVLGKPFDLDELLTCVQAALRGVRREAADPEH
jgi:DNA-binding response OmpR family regulator